MDAVATKPAVKDMPLTLPSMQSMTGELTTTATETTSKVSVEVKNQADAWIEAILAIEPKDLDTQNAVNMEAKSLGGGVEAELAQQSKLLQAPMSELMNDADNGSDVADNLLKLEEYARDIDPNGFDFSSVSGVRAFLAKIGFPTPLHRWIAKYQSTEAIIKSIETGLQQGKEKLKRDNVTLKEDQIRYRKILLKLDDYIAFAAYVDETIDANVAAVSDDEKKRFLQDEVLFPVRQRHQDLIT